MSECWFNLRVGVWHFQIKFGEWLKIRKSRNDYWGFEYRWLKYPIALYDFKPIYNIIRSR